MGSEEEGTAGTHPKTGSSSEDVGSFLSRGDQRERRGSIRQAEAFTSMSPIQAWPIPDFTKPLLREVAWLHRCGDPFDRSHGSRTLLKRQAQNKNKVGNSRHSFGKG